MRSYEKCSWSLLAWDSIVVNLVRSWFIEALLDHRTKAENLLLSGAPSNASKM